MDDRQFIADLLSALEYHTEQTRPIEFSKVAIEAAREYLRKPEQPAQQEPVECQYGKGGYACCEGGPCKADEQNNAPKPARQEPVEVKQIAEALRQVGLTLVRTRGSFRVMDLGRIEAQTTSPPAQQEPVSFLDWYDNAHWGNEDFKDGCWRAWDAALEHTSPPAQRTWVGLTDEERDDLLDNYITAEGRARAIEAKLKEKNT